MTKAIKRFALFVSLALAIPTIALAASFGTQNFFYAPSNVITPLPGFTTSWSGSGVTPIASGGTNQASQTTNGVNYFDGTHITSTTTISIPSSGVVNIDPTTYPQVIVGAADASPNSNFEINSQSEGSYTSLGLKNGTNSGLLTLDTVDSPAGVSNPLILDNVSGNSTCLEISGSANGYSCLDDYNSDAALFAVISPAYKVGGTEAGFTATINGANGTDSTDYGNQAYGSTAIDAYQNYYSSAYAQPLPEPDFSFWEAANGNTSESSTAWHWGVATTTTSGTLATTTALCFGDVGTTTLNAFSNCSPTRATFNVDSSSSRQVAFDVNTGWMSSSSVDFTVLNNDNVGIGSSTPWGMLSISPGVAASTTPQFVSLISGSSTPDFIVSSANNNGYIGIATGTPATALAVNGVVAVASDVDLNGPELTLGSGSNSISFGSSAGGRAMWGFNSINGVAELLAGSGKGIYLGVNGTNLSFPSGTAAIAILSGGNVGVGSTTPYGDFVVNAGTGDTAATLIGTYPIFQVASSTATATTTSFSVLRNGNISLGTGTYNSCTALTISSGIIGCTGSDERIKENITALDGATSLANLMQLNPVSFDYNPAAGAVFYKPGLKFGLIAQQVETVLPNLVTMTGPTPLTPGGTLQVDYDQLISYIISAVQSIVHHQSAQDAEINNLQAEVAALQNNQPRSKCSIQ